VGPVYWGVKSLAEWLSIRNVKTRLIGLGGKKLPRLHLRPEFLKELVEVFRPEVEMLSRLLDRDLSHWLETPQETSAMAQDRGTP